MATFPAAVEQWRSQITRFVPSPAGGVDYWLAWIQRESGGNICSYTSLRESGLFQLMPPDNTNAGGTTEALLRASCLASRAPSDADIRENMVSFSRYLDTIIATTRAKLAAVGASWSESSPDFWKMVKFQHTLPGPTATWLAAARKGLGRAPQSWDEIVPYAASAGVPAKWVEMANYVGGFGTGSEISLLIALAAGVGVMYYLWRKRRR